MIYRENLSLAQKKKNTCHICADLETCSTCADIVRQIVFIAFSLRQDSSPKKKKEYLSVSYPTLHLNSHYFNLQILHSWNCAQNCKRHCCAALRGRNDASLWPSDLRFQRINNKMTISLPLLHHWSLIFLSHGPLESHVSDCHQNELSGLSPAQYTWWISIWQEILGSPTLPQTRM